ncbi:hypothetical protein [Micromonospora costi]|uniref:hypothetical protein n=1 Tax=Micromonospora costi TaxID=1530042 RepID=UPI000EA9A881|nr:hypothetical protein [Micromonospora costi]
MDLPIGHVAGTKGVLVAWVDFSGFVATTDPLDAYGGISVPEQSLRNLMERLNSGSQSMTGHHDGLLPVRTRSVKAELRPTPRGGVGLWVEGEADEAEWTALGEVGGFSVGGRMDLAEEHWPAQPKAALRVSADLGWFPPEDLVAALRLMSRDFGVRGSHLLQLSALPPARIILEVALPVVAALGPNLAASALWDGLKLLLLRFQAKKGALARQEPDVPIPPPVFEFDVVGADDFRATAQLRTEDPEVLKLALGTMNAAIEAARVSGGSVESSPDRPHLMSFDPESGEWHHR